MGQKIICGPRPLPIFLVSLLRQIVRLPLELVNSQP